MSQSAENVVNTTAGICRIFDGKCRKKIRCWYMSQHRREMSQLLLTTKLIEKCMHDRTLLTIYNNTRVLSDLFDLALTFPHKSSAVFAVYKQL